MPEPLTGKCAVVSGASKGIGRAVALRLARDGADVALLARSAGALATVAEEITGLGRRAAAVPGDLRTLEGCTTAADKARTTLGAVDIFVHCAGATRGGLFVEQEDEAWLDGFALKFNAAVRLTREFWPSLVASRGTVVGKLQTSAE